MSMQEIHHESEAISPEGRPPLPDEVFVEGGLAKLLEEDFSADLLLPQPEFDTQAPQETASYDHRTEEVIERLKLPRNVSPERLSEVVSDELHALRELRDEREQELKRMRTLLAGDAHSLSDEEIDSMSVEELLEVKNVGGSIYNLRSAKDYEKQANSVSGKFQNGFANLFTGFGMFGEYVDQPGVAVEQTAHSLAIVQDYKEKIEELKTALAEADKGISEATAVDTQRQSVSQQLQNAEASGDQRAIQRARLQLERHTLSLERNLNIARSRLHTNVEIDYRRHQRGFNKLQEMFSKLDKAYEQADANRKLVQKVVIVTIAATTTTLLSGGAAGAFWLPVLYGTLAGGAAAFLSEIGEYGISSGLGLKTNFAASMKNAAWTTVDCALACVGGGWAGATTKIAGQTAVREGVSKGTSLLARRCLPLQMGLKQQLPSTAFYTASDIYTWSKDPTGKSGMDPRKVTEWGAKIGELMLGCVGAHTGHAMSARREAMRATSTKTVGGFISSKLGQASTYALDLYSNIVSTKLEIMMAQALNGREFTEQEIQQRYLAAWTGWGVGNATEKLQTRATTLGEKTLETASNDFKSTTETQRRNSGVGPAVGKDAVVEQTSGALPKSLKENDFNPATAHRDIQAAELENKFEENLRIDQVTGKPIAETIDAEVKALDRVFRRKKARGRLAKIGEETLKRLSSDQVALGTHDGSPESVLAYIDRFQGAAESKLARTTRQFDNHKNGTGPDKGLQQVVIQKLGDGVNWLSARTVDPIADYGSTMFRQARDKSYWKPSDNHGVLVGAARGLWNGVHQTAFNYLPQQVLYRGVDQPINSAVRAVSVDGDRLRGPIMHALLVYSGADAIGKGLRYVQRSNGLGHRQPIDAINFAGEQTQAKRWLKELEQVEALAEKNGLNVGDKLAEIRQKLEQSEKLAENGFAECNKSLGLGKWIEKGVKPLGNKVSSFLVGATDIRNGQNFFARTMRGENWPGPLNPVGTLWGVSVGNTLHAIATPVRVLAQPLKYAKYMESDAFFARACRGENLPQVPASLKWVWTKTGGAAFRGAVVPARVVGEYFDSKPEPGPARNRRILGQGAKNEFDTQLTRALSKVSEMKHVEMHQALEDRLRDAILGVRKAKKDEVEGLVALLHDRKAVSQEVCDEIIKNLTPVKRPLKSDGKPYTKKELKKIHDREGYKMREGRMQHTPGQRRATNPIYEDAANLGYVEMLTKAPSDSAMKSAPTLFEVYKQQAMMELKQPMWRVLGDKNYDVNPREVLQSFERLSTVLGHEEAMKFLNRGSEDRPSYLRKIHDASQKALEKKQVERAKQLQEVFDLLSAKASSEQSIEQIFSRWTEDYKTPEKMFNSLEQRLAEAISGTGEQRLSSEGFAAHLRLLHENELIPDSVRGDILSRLKSKTGSDTQGQECAALLRKTPAEIAELLPESLVRVPKLESVHTAWVKQEHLAPLLDLAKQDAFDPATIEKDFDSLQRLLGTREALELVQNGKRSVLGKLRKASASAREGTAKEPANPTRAKELEEITALLERLVETEERYAEERGFRHLGPIEKTADQPWVIGAENVEPIKRLAEAEKFISNEEFDRLLMSIPELKQQFDAMQKDFGTLDTISIFERGSLRDGKERFYERGFSGQTRWGKAILPRLRAKARALQDTNPYQANKLREVAEAIDGFIAQEREYTREHGSPRHATVEKYAAIDRTFGKTKITPEDAIALEAEVTELLSTGRIDPDQAMERLETIARQAKKRAEALVEPHYLRLLLDEGGNNPFSALFGKGVPLHPYGPNAELRRALRIARKNGELKDGKFVTPKAEEQLSALLKDPSNPEVSVDVFLAPTGINSVEHYLALLNPRHWFAETRTRLQAQEVVNAKLTTDEAVEARVREFVESPSKAFGANGSSAFTYAKDWLSLKPVRMYLRAVRAGDSSLTPMQRERSVEILQGQIDAPREKVRRRLKRYEKVQEKSQQIVKDMAQTAVRAFDPRYTNAKAVEEIANRMLVEQVGRREQPVLRGVQHSIWDHKPSNLLKDSVEQDPFWTRIADGLGELERSGYGREGSTAEARAARLRTLDGVFSALFGTPEQRTTRL